MRDDDRTRAVKQLLFDYVRSPSLRRGDAMKVVTQIACQPEPRSHGELGVGILLCNQPMTGGEAWWSPTPAYDPEENC